MPYMSQGGVKFTNHHIQSPLNHINASCQVCHRQSEGTLIQNVYERQEKNVQLRKKAENALVKAHIEAKAAWDAGATEDEMKEALSYIRHAQWRWDFVAASHGGSFHSPIESGRIISTGIDIAQEARIKLSRILASYGYNQELPYPDISTKAKAQKFIGLDMKKLYSDKEKFLKEVIPQWKKQAEEREKNYQIKNL
jgi:nitrite reductase (cytochrome c-552)